ncbi:MAG: signal peptidase II [Ahrensia sp.]|nr:signal peptidase II [Ahrensia sp.]
MENKLGSGFGIVGGIVAMDQAIKYWTETQMAYQQRIDILPFFDLFRVHNQGIAFSMFWGAGPWLLVTVAAAICAFVLWLWRSNPPERWLSHIGFGLIVGGALGNIIDRAMLGYVVDMFLFYLENWQFAVFNFADAAISVGAGAVILDELIAWRKTKPDDNPAV